MNDDVVLVRLGEKIKQLRQDQGFTLSALAAKTGLSIGLLSQLERGQGNPSFTTIANIAEGLGVSLGYFFDVVDNPEEMIVRRDRRKRIIRPNTEAVSLLTPDTYHSFEVLYSELDPGAVDKGPYSHPGEEFLLVLRGAYRLHHDDNIYDLAEGDSIIYRATVSHWGENPSNEVGQYVVVICPPSY